MKENSKKNAINAIEKAIAAEEDRIKEAIDHCYASIARLGKEAAEHNGHNDVIIIRMESMMNEKNTLEAQLETVEGLRKKIAEIADGEAE